MRTRNIQIILRLTPAEHQALRKCVAQSGLSQSAYLRLLITGHVPKALPPIEYHKLLRQLYAIGNNMNQIAAHANSTGFFTRIPLNSGISQGAMSQAVACDAFLADEYARNADELRQALLEIQAAFTLPERE